MKTLTDAQKDALSSAVRIAAEQYKKDAAAIRKPDGEVLTAVQQANFERLARTFDGQERDALALADLIEDADTVTLDGGSQ